MQGNQATQRTNNPNKEYDSEGRELLPQLFSTYLDTYDQYLETIKKDPTIHQGFFTKLEDLLYPNQAESERLKKILKQQTDIFFQKAKNQALKAIALRRGGFLGYGADQNAYEVLALQLKKMAKSVEAKILETPWHVPVEKEHYLLTALIDSPDAFLDAQQDTQLQDAIEGLNSAKTQPIGTQVTKSSKDRSQCISQYVAKVTQVESDFQTKHSKYLEKIIKIETIRRERWAITNFFVDLFTEEKEKLEHLKNKISVTQTLEKKYQQLAPSTVLFTHQHNFVQFSSQLLKGEFLDSSSSGKLHQAIKFLVENPLESKKIKQFTEQLYKTICGNIVSLSKSEKANNTELIEYLKVQLHFLKASATRYIPILDNIRIKLITFLKNTLEKFQDPEVALAFIKKIDHSLFYNLSLDDHLKTILEKRRGDYQSWKKLHDQDKKLFQENLTISELQDLRENVLIAQQSSLPQIRKAANQFNQTIKVGVISQIKKFHENSDPDALKKITLILIQFFQFYSSDKKHLEINGLSGSIKDIIDYIIKCFNQCDTPQKLFALISKWDQVPKGVIQSFDVVLEQNISTIKQQHKSFEMLEDGWNALLNDRTASLLTEAEVKQYIEAILRLDELKFEKSHSPITNRWDKSKHSLKSDLQKKLQQLKNEIIDRLEELSQHSLADEQQKALRVRLQFMAHEHALYTENLSTLREEIIKTLKKCLNNHANLQELKRYLTDLANVVPSEWKTDEELSKLIKLAKQKLIRDSFDEEKRILHEEYQNEIHFLKTGNIDLYKRFTSIFQNEDLRALTFKNLSYWQNKFLFHYTNAFVESANLALILSQFNNNDSEDKKILNDYLQELIRDDYKEIADSLTLDLIERADIPHQIARAKLDKIFDLPMTSDLFMFRYLAIAEYQNYYSQTNNTVLNQAGRNFIRQFHHFAQHEGGFTTHVVAKLPLDALRAMYSTWADNPKISLAIFSDVKRYVNSNLTGEVNENCDNYIQLPRYLFLNIVLELIATDINDLLRGEDVDINLLNDRIEFAIPKLEEHFAYENKFKENEAFRGELLLVLKKFNYGNLYCRYTDLLSQKLNSENYSTKPIFNHWGLLGNVNDCEKEILRQLKSEVREQVNFLSHYNLSDLDDDLDVSAVQVLDETLKAMQVRIKEFASDECLTEEKAREKEALLQSVDSLTKSRDTHQQSIRSKNLRLAWILEFQQDKEFSQQIECVNQLLDDNHISLKDFISQLNIKLYDLLPQKTSVFCAAIKENIAVSALFSDKSFMLFLKNLSADLEGKKKNIFDIIRSLPDSLIRELPKEEGDLIRQLQYRFADRFKSLMLKIFSERHLNWDQTKEPIQTLNATDQKSNQHATDLDASSHQKIQKASKISASTLLSFFQSSPKKDEPSVTSEVKLLAKERLKNGLEGVRIDTIKKMLAVLLTTESDSKDLSHVYKLFGMSAPKPIYQPHEEAVERRSFIP